MGSHPPPRSNPLTSLFTPREQIPHVRDLQHLSTIRKQLDRKNLPFKKTRELPNTRFLLPNWRLELCRITRRYCLRLQILPPHPKISRDLELFQAPLSTTRNSPGIFHKNHNIQKLPTKIQCNKPSTPTVT